MIKSSAALVVAAGRGTRLADAANSGPKQYRQIGGKPVLTHTLNVFGNHPRISHILTVIHPDDQALYEKAVSAAEPSTRRRLLSPVFGGDTRQKSVHAGLVALADTRADFVFIHDAARPFLTLPVLDRLVMALERGAEGVLAAVEVADTLKKKTGAQEPLETVDRTNLWAAQTPQAFVLDAILSAHNEEAQAGRHDFTDDTSLAEANGIRVDLCPGDPANFKITTAADLQRAQTQVKQFQMNDNGTERKDKKVPLSQLNDVRTGTGYDVHAFEEGDSVVLGGVSIPHTHKLKGHSDADVVLHAITDATLGAIGDGDIGQHFPPSDPKWKGASSDRFQIDALNRVESLGGRVAHIDVTIVCEAPKINPHRGEIREAIAALCDLPQSRVSVKATTSERLGFTGRKEGIAALASVTIRLPLDEEE